MISAVTGEKKWTLDNSMALFRHCLFIAFFLLSVRFVTVHLGHLPLLLSVAGIIGVLVLGAVSWIRLPWVLFIFLAGIPFVSGLKITGFLIPAPFLGFSFAVIYSTWFLRRVVWNRDTLEPRSIIGNMADIMSALIMISLVMSFQPYPADFVLRRIWALSVLAQKDIFWSIDASYILLQGIFLYRILALEMNGKTLHGAVVSIIYAQASIIILFSSLHLFFHIPDKFHYGSFGIFSPFDDAHSYGSYLAFLFFVFLSMAITGNGRRRMISVVFACLLLLFIVFSGSRVTWITLVLVGICLLLYIFGKRGRIILICAVFVPLILINLCAVALKQSDNEYVKRLNTVVLFKGYITRDINTSLSGRPLWWSRAWNIIAEEPATGIGIGSFYRVSPLYTPEDYKKFSHVHENAHNYYVQMAAEAGIPALLLFLGILYFTFYSGTRVLSRKDFKEKGLFLGLLFGLGAYIITMLTNHPLLLSNQQFLFWSIIAFITTAYHSSEEDNSWKLLHPFPCLILGLLFIATVAGYSQRIARGKDRPGINEYGYYGYDTSLGEEMRWTSKMSGIRLYGETAILGLTICAGSQHIDKDGLLLTVFADDKVLDTIHLAESGKKFLYYYIPSVKDRMVEIRTLVDHTFNPYRKGLTQDMRKNREQGVALGPVTFLRIMPRNGIGFYDFESWEEKEFYFEPEGMPKRFRWTGRQASINVHSKFKNGLMLFLLCTHPDIDKEPVEVEIMCDDHLVRNEKFTESGWRRIVIKAEELKGSNALTFRTSRTWNPKLEGLSEDGRDLGVAVAWRGV